MERIKKANDGWKEIAKMYDKKTEEVVSKELIDAIKERISSFSDLSKCMELGCGTGMYSPVIAKRSKKLIGIDPFQEMIDIAKNKKKENEELGNVEYRVCDAKNMEVFEDNSFDTIVVANVLHCVPEPEIILKEMKRVLRKDGKVIAISYTSEEFPFFKKLFSALRMATKYKFSSIWKLKKDMKPMKKEKFQRLIAKEFKVTNSEMIGKKKFIMQAVLVEGINSK